MASDPSADPTAGAPPDDDDDTEGLDREEVRAIVREEIEGVLASAGILDRRKGAGAADPSTSASDAGAQPVTAREVEEITNRTVTKAMGDLNRKPRKAAPKSTAKPPPEPPPANPPRSILERARETLWG